MLSPKDCFNKRQPGQEGQEALPEEVELELTPEGPGELAVGSGGELGRRWAPTQGTAHVKGVHSIPRTERSPGWHRAGGSRFPDESGGVQGVHAWVGRWGLEAGVLVSIFREQGSRGKVFGNRRHESVCILNVLLWLLCGTEQESSLFRREVVW